MKWQRSYIEGLSVSKVGYAEGLCMGGKDSMQHG